MGAVTKIVRTRKKSLQEGKKMETATTDEVKTIIDTRAIMTKIQCNFCVCQSKENKNDYTCWEEAKMGIQCKGFLADERFGLTGALVGLPRGFSRMGPMTEDGIIIFQDFTAFTKVFPGGNYTRGNVAVWKYFYEKEGWTLVRGLSPRLNKPFLHIFLENCMDKIPGALTIAQTEVDAKD